MVPVTIQIDITVFVFDAASPGGQIKELRQNSYGAIWISADICLRRHALLQKRSLGSGLLKILNLTVPRGELQDLMIKVGFLDLVPRGELFPQNAFTFGFGI